VSHLVASSRKNLEKVYDPKPRSHKLVVTASALPLQNKYSVLHALEETRTKRTEKATLLSMSIQNLNLTNTTENAAFGFLAMGSDPESVEDALNGTEADQWRLAIDDELNSMTENEAWEIVDRPENAKVISSKLILRKKYKADGTIDKYKARLVARGFTQVEGVDYTETFAPVVKYQSLRTILALAAAQSWEVHQMDVKTAFLNGVLKEEVYMDLPTELKTPDQEGKVCKLKRSIYGLKQAPRAWYEKLETEITTWGFQKLNTDHSVFVKGKDSHRVIIAVYVDDVVISGPQISNIQKIKEAFKQAFRMVDFGLVSSLLGMEVFHGRESIQISQRKYAELILKRFNMLDCTPVSTPWNLKLS